MKFIKKLILITAVFATASLSFAAEDAEQKSTDKKDIDVKISQECIASKTKELSEKMIQITDLTNKIHSTTAPAANKIIAKIKKTNFADINKEGLIAILNDAAILVFSIAEYGREDQLNLDEVRIGGVNGKDLSDEALEEIAVGPLVKIKNLQKQVLEELSKIESDCSK